MRDEVQRYSLFEDVGILRAGFIHDFLPYFQTYEVPYISAHKTHFFPEKFDLNSTCVLCAEGKNYFQTYKNPYIYYTTYFFREIVKTIMKMILVAVTTIFWVSMMNKLYYGC